MEEKKQRASAAVIRADGADSKGGVTMVKFSIDDIRSLMSAVSIIYNIATRKEAKDYWNDLANRLNELEKEMERERLLDLMRRAKNESK